MADRRITNEQREAIVRKAVADRDALLLPATTHPAPSTPEGVEMPEPGLRICEHCGCSTNAAMRRCCGFGWSDDLALAKRRAPLPAPPAAKEQDHER